MKKLTEIVKGLMAGNPYKPLFIGTQSRLEEQFYETLYLQLSEEKSQQLFQKQVLKNKLNTLSNLRLLFFYFYCIKKHNIFFSSLKDACWKPVMVHSKFRERYHAVEMKVIELFQEYIDKTAMTVEQKDVSLIETINRCNFILEVLEISNKLVFTLAHRVNIPSESVFELIFKYVMVDMVACLQELCTFVEKYSQLIIQDHAQMLSINHIYEKTIFFHREIAQLCKFSKEEIEVPKLHFDDEMNKKIEGVIREYRQKHVEYTPRKMASSNTEVITQISDEVSLVKLIDKN